LRDTLALAEAYDAQPIGQGITALQALYTAAEARDSNVRSTLEIDMATAFESRMFSAEVAGELARAAEAMLRISTASPYPAHLVSYRREFLDRYGEGREVPLLELLDEDIGLGPPATYQRPARIRESPPQPPQQYPARDRTLLEIAATALRTEQREIVLDETTLRRLQIRDSWRDSAPDSLELYVSIAAPSQAAIDNGTYLVAVGPRIGDRPAGRSFGRFCDILGDDSVQALTRRSASSPSWSTCRRAVTRPTSPSARRSGATRSSSPPRRAWATPTRCRWTTWWSACEATVSTCGPSRATRRS
jgi:hypothetical protein